MAFVFGAIPFTDALIVRYVDDRMRSRVAGVRLAIAFGVSSLAVWLLGPLVKANGFAFLLGLMAAIAARLRRRGDAASPPEVAARAWPPNGESGPPRPIVPLCHSVRRLRKR